MPIDIKDIICEPFGKCVLISNSVIEVCVTVDKGPRIIHFGFINEKNVLFSKNTIDINSNLKFNASMSSAKNLDKYSGHNLLLKDYPTKKNVPIIDNQPVIYSILPKGIRFIPPYKDLQTSIEIILSENTNNLMVLHSVKNLSHDKRNLVICASTSFPKKNGILIVPQNEKNLNISPNRIISLWPYSKINDSQLTFFDKYITFTSSQKNKNPFRLGTNNHLGWVTFARNKTAIFKRFVHNSKAKYLNGESSLEFFANENILTVETLSPIFKINKNEVARHVENWSIFKTDIHEQLKSEEQIDNFLDSIG
ncbi:MAG: hypothetical protein RUMPE_01020 [Eubacteriales bacterium SKADARSKE-1]|nr:hypothetical protein [Eubacteriales bacterium SKADARSKE-1]